MANKIVIHTDGSCIGNPGPGGWGATLQFIKEGEVRAEREISGYRPATTNNRMELMAIIEGLSALKSPRYASVARQTVEIVTDSQYVIGALNGNRARRNKELIRCLRRLASKHKVSTRKVRGHSGHEGNEQVDDLARGEAEELARLLSAEMSIVAFGSRGFKDYRLLKQWLDFYLSTPRLRGAKSNEREITVISGDAPGPDKMGAEYAIANGHGLVMVPALWDIYGKKAGYLRNKEMVKIATHGVAFWDGKSKGTANMIELCKKHNVKLRVVKV